MAYLSLTETSESELKNIPVTNGQLIFCNDTGNFYKDSATSRIKMSSGFVICSELPLAPLSNKLYVLLPNTLCFFNEKWINLNESPIIIKDRIENFPALGDPSQIYISTKENKIYFWNNSDMKYCCIGGNYNEISIINGGGAT